MTTFNEQFNELVKSDSIRKTTTEKPDRQQREYTGNGRVSKKLRFLSG